MMKLLPYGMKLWQWEECRMWFDRIKRFYDGGFWTKEMVADGVRMNRITAEQYEEITGEVYEG